MPTAKDLIYGAFRSIGWLRTGQTASPEAIADGFTMLNSMVETWNIERLMTLTEIRSEFALTVGQAVYTLGAGGNWNIPRPVRIERAGVIITNTPQVIERPIDVLTVQNWAENVPVKDIQSGLVMSIYPEMTFPLINVHAYPVPSVGGYKIALYSWSQMTAFADQVTNYTFPPGYDMALRFNLALLLWPLFVINSKSQANQTQLQQVQTTAVESKAKIKALNAPTIEMRVDPALTRTRGYFNWRTG